MNSEELVYVGLGSNLENPKEQVRQAFLELQDLPLSRCTARSHQYLSRPMGPADQPEYVNAVAELRTQLAPEALLAQLQRIEAEHGRVRDGTRWGPRTLDLDLLLYGQRSIDRPALTVPHPGLSSRAFVLLPLLEVAGPELLVPGRGLLKTLAASCDRSGVERI